jgi:hypothetical protein
MIVKPPRGVWASIPAVLYAVHCRVMVHVGSSPTWPTKWKVPERLGSVLLKRGG